MTNDAPANISWNQAEILRLEAELAAVQESKQGIIKFARDLREALLGAKAELADVREAWQVVATEFGSNLNLGLWPEVKAAIAVLNRSPAKPATLPND